MTHLNTVDAKPESYVSVHSIESNETEKKSQQE